MRGTITQVKLAATQGNINPLFQVSFLLQEDGSSGFATSYFYIPAEDELDAYAKGKERLRQQGHDV